MAITINYEGEPFETTYFIDENDCWFVLNGEYGDGSDVDCDRWEGEICDDDNILLLNAGFPPGLSCCAFDVSVKLVDRCKINA